MLNCLISIQDQCIMQKVCLYRYDHPPSHSIHIQIAKEVGEEMRGRKKGKIKLPYFTNTPKKLKIPHADLIIIIHAGHLGSHVLLERHIKVREINLPAKSFSPDLLVVNEFLSGWLLGPRLEGCVRDVFPLFHAPSQS